MISSSAMRNIRMMHVLEGVAGTFNEAGIPLMVLKGAALYLTLYRRPDEREMTDLDLMVKPPDVDRAMKILESLGYHRGEASFREDFFPRYYYEVQYRVGSICPVSIDLHVRPFRVLRLSRVVPDDAMWRRAVAVSHGNATVLVPAADDMLIHLAAHSAIHGNDHRKWLHDIDCWIRAHRRDLDWDRFLATVESWKLTGAVRSGIDAARRLSGPACPDDVQRRLGALRTNWRDRLALWHAPRDRRHMTRSFVVNVLTTPGVRFVLGYVRDVLVPDRAYLDEWCTRHRCRRPTWALFLRFLGPLLSRAPRPGGRHSNVEVRSSPAHGLGVFATREISQGDVIARYRGRPVDRDGTYVSNHTDASGHEQRHEITGPLKYLNHSCRPNAALGGFRIRALVPIRAGQEITMSYGDDMCDCDREARQLQGIRE